MSSVSDLVVLPRRIFWKAVGVGVVSGFLIWAIAAASIMWVYYEAYDNQLLSTRRNLTHLAELAASQIDGDMHAEIQEASQQNGALYLHTITPLLRLHNATPEIYYMYTLRPQLDHYEFILDTAMCSDGLQSHAERSLVGSPIGEHYQFNASNQDLRYLNHAIAHGHAYVFPELIKDSYGNFITALSPFYSMDGSLSGLLAIDHATDQLDHQNRGIRQSALTAILLAGLIAGLAALVMVRFRLSSEKMAYIRHLAEMELRRAEYMLRDMAENVPGAIFRGYYRKGGEYGLTYMSARSKELFHFFPEEALRQGTIPNLHPEDRSRFWDSLRATVLSGSDWSFEGRLLLENGGTLWFSGLAKPTSGEQDETILNGVIVDISERKEFELRLKEAKCLAEAANRAKSDFLANMSHEIRTPLNGILGMAAILENTQATDEQQECISTIKSSSELLLSVINDILDISKIEAGHLELETRPFDFFESISSLMDLMKPRVENKDLKLEFDYSKHLPRTFHGDEYRLKQILLNLIGNAIKFTQKGVVRILVQGEKSVHPSWALTIVVEDQGIGIPKDKLSLIFEPFRQAHSYTTRQYGGTGLGLSICQKLILLMGGSISVQSREGKGSSFKIKLSLDEAVLIQKRRQTNSLSPIPQAANLKILLAEDNVVNQKVALKILEKLGYHADIANNGQEAVAATLSFDYDIVLMDVQMPMMDGLEASRQIHLQLGAKAPKIVALTAHAMPEQVSECLKAGMQAHLSKPLRIEELKSVLLASQSKDANLIQAKVDPGLN